ncbi:MAG: hypothetical protein JST26_05605 [Bacteroidetes bacterium]|nr:hypothetical protein [Bacteroidota bacterium]
MKKFFFKIKGWKWKRVLLVFAMISLVVAVIKVDAMLESVSYTFKSIVTMPRLFHCIMGGAMVIAISHLIWVPKGGIAKEHLLFKRVGPIFSVPLTVLTHFIFVYCGLIIIYLFCYEDGTTMKFNNLDKTTVALTMLTLMTYAFYSIGLILSDIFNPKEEKTGTLMEETTEASDQKSVGENNGNGEDTPN